MLEETLYMGERCNYVDLSDVLYPLVFILPSDSVQCSNIGIDLGGASE